MNLLPLFNYLLPFFGAIIGMTTVYFLRPRKPIAFKLILAFSGAFLLGITLFHLMPEIFSDNAIKAGPWVMTGLLLQMLLEYLSQGAEHGHSHSKENTRPPWLILASLGLHAFIEGLPLSTNSELLFGLFIHKIPIGMVVFFLIWETRVAKTTKLGILFLFAIMSPLGSLIHDSIWYFTSLRLQITGIVVGMLLHISTTILFESNQGHAFNLGKLMTILIGFGISYLL
jgi:zinc transporter ZupT